jgi:hypothetical protein
MGRDELDRYYTPDALAEACLSLMLGDLPWPDCLRFAEPCCGGGAFGRAARRLMPSRVRVKGCDLDPEARTIEQIMCSDDPPDEIYVSRQRPRWGGAGGAACSSGDTCGSAFMVWHLDWRPRTTTIKGMPDWRPRGRA